MRAFAALRIVAFAACLAAGTAQLIPNSCAAAPSAPVTFDARAASFSIPSLFDGVMFNVSLSAAAFSVLRGIAANSPGQTGLLTLSSAEVAPGPNCTGIAVYTSSGVTATNIGSSRAWSLWDVFSFRAVEQTTQQLSANGAVAAPNAVALDLTRAGSLSLNILTQPTLGLYFRCSATESPLLLPSLFANYASQDVADTYFTMSRAYAASSFPVLPPANIIVPDDLFTVFYGTLNYTIGCSSLARSPPPRPPFPPFQSWPPGPPPQPPPPPPSPSVLTVRWAPHLLCPPPPHSVTSSLSSDTAGCAFSACLSAVRLSRGHRALRVDGRRLNLLPLRLRNVLLRPSNRRPRRRRLRLLLRRLLLPLTGDAGRLPHRRRRPRHRRRQPRGGRGC